MTARLSPESPLASAASWPARRPPSVHVSDDDAADRAIMAACGIGLCSDCPPVGYPTDKTRCAQCPRRAPPLPGQYSAAKACVLTQARLKELLHYDHETGVFTWLAAGGSAHINDIAGSLSGTGYSRIKISKREYLSHRLAWFYMTGEWPSAEIDHVNLDKADNRWANLREATPSQNHANKGRLATNTSGFKGITRHRAKWKAAIEVHGRSFHLGVFDTPDAAHAAYAGAAKKYFDKYARTS